MRMKVMDKEYRCRSVSENILRKGQFVMKEHPLKESQNNINMLSCIYQDSILFN